MTEPDYYGIDINMLCHYCTDLSIEHLVALAKEEFSGHIFPSAAYYQHHASFADLVQAAKDGCDLCQLIADCFRGINWGKDPGGNADFRPISWEGLNCELHASAYAAAMYLPISDVKLAVSTYHTSRDESLDAVRDLTMLMVQVGPVRPKSWGRDYDYYDDYDESRESAFPFLTLTLTTSSEEPAEIEGFRIGRLQTDPDLGSARNFGIAKAWLTECRAQHGCLLDTVPELPTRVVDVGPASPNPLNPRVVLSRGKRADYIALSHCWGGMIPTVLNSNTYNAYQAALPWDQLPRNFRHACRIARGLGIRYLWIDSLCIIQDSKSDWGQESKKMASIYRNATLTVSALVADSSTDGILTRYDDELGSVPLSTSLKIFKDTDYRADVVEVEWHPHGEENFHNLSMVGALNDRGWTLQEYVLSPRNLLFGSRQIYWRCPSVINSADGVMQKTRSSNTIYDDTISQIIFADILARKKPDAEQQQQQPLDAQSLLLDSYYDLAERYSERSLTYPSDKLPAFSGIARCFHPGVGVEYLAGIWASDIHAGLLWQADTGTAVHAKTYRAPSWSWMVTDEPVCFMKRPLRRTEYSMRVLQHSIVLEDPTNPYGPVVSGHLVVQGRVGTLVRDNKPFRPRTNADYKLICGHVAYDEPPTPDAVDTDEGLPFFRTGDENKSNSSFISMGIEEIIQQHQDPNANGESVSGTELLILMVQTGEGFIVGKKKATGLVLRPVSGGLENRYQRIGYIAFSTNVALDMFDAWDTRTLVLV